uniref:Tc1-like transposase DDE domain-containing protein n=1 Tax=Hucho hucho TaxID=62062 RepID=A0A4W5LY69_9TELE
MCGSYHEAWRRSTITLLGYLTKKEIDGVLHQMTWPPHSPNLNPFEMVWDELDRREKEKQPTSA